jgi:glucuronate isomerase
MRKYLTEIVEVAGIHNLAGFNDDAGMLLSMPLKHTLWRRVISNWAAGLVVQGEIAYQEALQVVYQLAYAQAKFTYNL